MPDQAINKENIINIKEDIKEMKEYMKGEFADVKSTIKDLSKEIKRNYVTKAEFKPIKAFVYTLVGAIMMAVLAALLALII